jgi:hypothetical protein
MIVLKYDVYRLETLEGTNFRIMGVLAMGLSVIVTVETIINLFGGNFKCLLL